jgi:hypothetical protein
MSDFPWSAPADSPPPFGWPATRRPSELHVAPGASESADRRVAPSASWQEAYDTAVAHDDEETAFYVVTHAPLGSLRNDYPPEEQSRFSAQYRISEDW